MSVTDDWRPKRPGPASDRDTVTRQTLRAGIRVPPPEKPDLRIGAWENTAQHSQNVIRPTALGSIWEQVLRGRPFRLASNQNIFVVFVVITCSLQYTLTEA